ncbi:hypothetical protein [Metabacillus sp. Hm71]|uniref:hypothetical protein n=1 Tax=Metabacillus sp. Hm71 TaxID=3450743 RepID=UPI003F444A1F
MNLDPRIEYAAHDLCYKLGENRNGPMSDKDRHDIFFSMRAVADYWRKDSEKIRKENHARRWNGLRKIIRENPNLTLREVQMIMLHLDNDGSIHDFKFE